MKRLFVLLPETDKDRPLRTKYYVPTVEKKNYNVKIDGQNFLDQSVRNKLRTYENARKI